MQALGSLDSLIMPECVGIHYKGHRALRASIAAACQGGMVSVTRLGRSVRSSTKPQVAIRADKAWQLATGLPSSGTRGEHVADSVFLGLATLRRGVNVDCNEDDLAVIQKAVAATIRQVFKQK